MVKLSEKKNINMATPIMWLGYYIPFLIIVKTVSIDKINCVI